MKTVTINLGSIDKVKSFVNVSQNLITTSTWFQDVML